MLITLDGDDRGPVIDDEHAIQVIDFVLYHAGWEPAYFLLHFPPVCTEAAHNDCVRAPDINLDVRKAQAAFPQTFLALRSTDFGIGQRDQFLTDFGNDHSLCYPHLRRSQSDPLVPAHESGHGLHQHTNRAVDISNRQCLRAENRIRVQP
jgi:hypothetical protein